MSIRITVMGAFILCLLQSLGLIAGISLDFGDKSSAIKIVGAGSTLKVVPSTLTIIDGTVLKCSGGKVNGNLSFINSNCVDSISETQAGDIIYLRGSDSFFGLAHQVNSGVIVSNENNRLGGIARLNGPICLQDSNATLTLAVYNTLNQNIKMNNGTIVLENNLAFADDFKFTGSGLVDFNGFRVIFGGDSLSWGYPFFWKNANDLALNSQMTVTGIWYFSGNSRITGNGNIVDLTSGGSIWIKSGTTLSIADAKLKGLGSGRIVFEDDTSQLRFSQVEIEMDGNVTWTTGGVYVEGPTTIVTQDKVLTLSNLASMTVDSLALEYDTLDFGNENSIQPIVSSDPNQKFIAYVNNGIIRKRVTARVLATHSNALLRLTTNNSNALLACCKNNSNTLLRLNANNSNALIQLNANNSNAIISGSGTTLAQNTSQALLYLIKNQSNAMLFCCKNNSNALLRLNENNSNAIMVLDRKDRTDSNALIRLTTSLSNAMLFCCKNNSNALIRLNANNSNALIQLNANNSNAIISGSGTTLAQNTSQALLYLIKNQSNAMLFCCKNNSNALLRLSANNSNALLRLNANNSNAILVLDRKERTDSNALIRLTTSLSNAMLFCCKNNSNALLRLSANNSNALLRLNANNSNAIMVLDRKDRTDSNALIRLTTSLSNAMLFCCKNNSNTLLRLNANNSNALLKLNANNSNAIVAGNVGLAKYTSHALLYLIENESNALLHLFSSTSNALLACCKNNSNALLRLNANNSNAILAGSGTTLAQNTSQALLYLIKNQSNALLACCRHNSNAIVWLKTQVDTIDHGPFNIVINQAPVHPLGFDLFLSSSHVMQVTVDTTINGSGHTIKFSRKIFDQMKILPGVKVVLENIVLEDFDDRAIKLMGVGSEVIFGNCTKIMLSDCTNATKNWTFVGDAVVYGDGNILDLVDQKISVLQPGHLMIQNSVLHNVRNNNIACVGPNAEIAYKGSSLCLSHDYTFSVGSMRFIDDNSISGTMSFMYTSSGYSSIDRHSSLLLDKGVSFHYAPSVENRDLISMQDRTAQLFLNGCTLVSSVTGMRLTSGTLCVDHKNILRNTGATSVSQGFAFGNGTAGSDLDIQVFPGGSIELADGVLDYANVDV